MRRTASAGAKYKDSKERFKPYDVNNIMQFNRNLQLILIIYESAVAKWIALGFCIRAFRVRSLVADVLVECP